MNNIYDYALSILKSGSIEDKVTPYQGKMDFCLWKGIDWKDHYPERERKIAFSSIQEKFPKVSKFHDQSIRAKALHFFANHELLAIEIMALMIVKFPTLTQDDHRVKLGLLKTLKDEQIHFNLYLKRMRQLGIDFGDYHLNDFFWRYTDKLKSLDQYYCFMPLTFEAANLDFSLFYQKVFQDVEDHQSVKILKKVYDDEISHVRFGVQMIKGQQKGLDLYKFYLENLPEGLSPARSKGMVFDHVGREKAGFDREMIETIKTYKDDFQVVNRKSGHD
ncbi:MAG: DUF455 family protein [Bacteriovoracaceae bacterium]